jgi:hypothetical protein
MMQRIMNYNLVGYIYTMAEIAVPLLGLGAMYIISNQGDDKDKVEERFTNMG